MATVATVPNLILAVGVLLLVGPPLWRAGVVWFRAVTGRGLERRDEQRATVVEVLDLKDRLESAGNPAATKLCRDLLFAVVYGDETPPRR